MKTPSAELIELCGAVRDEIATPEQIARLEMLLANDSEARRFYRQITQISALLERYERVPAEAPPTAATARATWHFGVNRWLALAAGLAVLLAVYFQLKPRPLEAKFATAPIASNTAPVAYVQDSHRCTVIPRVGPAVALNDSFPLRAGDIVATAPNGSAIIRFADENTLFILSPDTRAWLAREGSIKIVHLTSGQLYGDVAPQQDGAQWRILTADGEAKVLGTRLAVSALAEGTRVAVTSGLVRVTARDSRQSIETPAGYATQLTPTTATLVKLAPSEPTRLASFTLVNAENNQPIAGFENLRDGVILDLAALPVRRLNIQANCEPQLVGAVRFALKGFDPDGNPLHLVVPLAHSFPNQIEAYYPYMLAGDPSLEGQPLPDHSFAWTPPVGRYTLTATPYATMKSSGARGDALTIRFEVVDNATRK